MLLFTKRQFLIMSLESVFAAIGGYMLLGERMETMELWGCAIIFIAVIVSLHKNVIRLSITSAFRYTNLHIHGLSCVRDLE